MSEEVKRVKKQVEVEVVELKIEVSAEFFERVEQAKKLVADKRGYDTSYGEYIEEAMNDLVAMVDDYSVKLRQASDIIQQQDEALGQAEVIKEEEPVDPESGEPEEAPENLYAHIIKDEDKHTMYQ